MALVRMSRAAALVFAVVLVTGCASPLPKIADETKVEEWGRCRSAQPNFTVLCLQMRRPM